MVLLLWKIGLYKRNQMIWKLQVIDLISVTISRRFKQWDIGHMHTVLLNLLISDESSEYILCLFMSSELIYTDLKIYTEEWKFDLQTHKFFNRKFWSECLNIIKKTHKKIYLHNIKLSWLNWRAWAGLCPSNLK
jgi:hypothetical protein